MAAALMLIAGIVRVALFSLSRRSRGEKGAHIHRQIVSAVPNLHQVLITLGGFIGLYEAWNSPFNHGRFRWEPPVICSCHVS